jgi:catechol 2,3-dioxygenase-like lactoylglutathione lyase family enzyme
MLAAKKMVGFVITKDSARSREFYEQKLGFTFVSKDQFALVMKTEQNMIRISESKDAVAAQHTILGWQVEQIEPVATWLTERGVVFERYGWAKQDSLGIWTAPSGDKVAWFKDPDGNVLSISEHR